MAWCIEHRNDDFTEDIKQEYENISPSKTEKVGLDVFIQKAYELLDKKEIKVLVMNGKTDIDSDEYAMQKE